MYSPPLYFTMEHQQEKITPLLENIVRDNPTYQFPVSIIRDELINLFLNQEEYDYFLRQCYNKLNTDVHNIFANIFLMLLDEQLLSDDINPYDMPESVYKTKIDIFISTLENLNVTRITKDSPDGYLLSAIV